MQANERPAERGTDTQSIIDADLARQLGEAVEALEDVPWSDVPGVGAETASTFTQRLATARQDVVQDQQGDEPRAPAVRDDGAEVL